MDAAAGSETEHVLPPRLLPGVLGSRVQIDPVKRDLAEPQMDAERDLLSNTGREIGRLGPVDSIQLFVEAPDVLTNVVSDLLQWIGDAVRDDVRLGLVHVHRAGEGRKELEMIAGPALFPGVDVLAVHLEPTI